MTDREAIEGLEYLVSPTCTDSKFDYVEEIEHAISALQEREERSKGCEYCDPAKYYSSIFRKYGVGTKELGLGLGIIEGNLLYAERYDDPDSEVVISFCPMCGRPLKGEGNV